MCNCGKSGAAAAARAGQPTAATPSAGYVVTFPDGRTEKKTTAIAAQLAAARVPGATYQPR